MDIRLCTASSDDTALVLFEAPPTWEGEANLPHPDFVRAVAVSLASNLIATACRDGGVRVFDFTAAEELGTYWGHFDEVTSLVLVRVAGVEKLVSAGIDGTVRTWSLDRADVGGAPKLEELLAAGEVGDQADEDEKGKKKEGQGGVLTEEEERELEELMSDEEDE